MDVTLVFPNQLYPDHPAIAKSRAIVLAECDVYFSQYRFHKHKLVLHRASMKSFQHELESRGHTVDYLEYGVSGIEVIMIFLYKEGFREIHYADPTDYLVERRLVRYAAKNSMELRKYNSPNFICTPEYLNDFFQDTAKYRLTDFYIAQRKRLGILVSGGSPVGGQWTFDTENRKKLPKDEVVPERRMSPDNEFVAEAKRYVNKHFGENPGSTDTFSYAIDPAGARQHFQFFLRRLFLNYGIYQDAIRRGEAELFHSLLTPYLNTGLLSPQEIVAEALGFAEENKVPLNSLEGFIRQIVGWREFIRAIYIREGVKQRTANFWNHTGKLPRSFWDASTGIAPVDDSIRKVLKYSYTHHIERLMVLGNFMLLCEFDPDEVYRWFMEMFIDSYDWVMVPNVYGMSQFADGGMMSTKPYISGSNYILNMSDYGKEPWCEVWDGLFWSFIARNREFFAGNPRLSMMAVQLEKMDPERRDQHRTVRERFLKELSATSEV